MPEEKPGLSPEVKTAVCTDIGVITGACLLVTGWVLFVLSLFGIEIGHGESDPSDAAWKWKMYLGIALGGTAIGLLTIWLRARRVIGLMRDGVDVVGTITEIGSIGFQGMVHLKFRYEFEGREYRQQISVTRNLAESVVVGQEVTVRVDRNQPKRCLLREENIPLTGPGAG